MKRRLSLVVLLFAIFAVACSKLDKLLTFYINHTETIKIESGLLAGVLVPLSPVAVKTNSEDTFKNHKTRAELVKNVTLDGLTLTITDPQNENFNFLRNIEIFISNEKDGDTKLAFLNEVPQNVNSITLESTNAQLDKYLKASTYTIKTRTTLARSVTRDISIKAAMRFKVTASPI